MRSFVLSGALHAVALGMAFFVSLRWSVGDRRASTHVTLVATRAEEVPEVVPEPEPEPAPELPDEEARLVEPTRVAPSLPLPPEIAPLPLTEVYPLLAEQEVARRVLPEQPTTIPAKSPPPPKTPSEAGPGDVEPILIEAPSPTYPSASVRLREEGSVRCRLHVDAAGAVTKVEVVEPSGFARLDRAAVEAFRRWRFQPRETEGKPVPTTVLHTFTFRLRS